MPEVDENATQATAPLSAHSPKFSHSNVTMSGYLHKLETRTISLLSRRRYWFAVAEMSPYLYWFKERDDVQFVGRLCLTGAAFTYDPKEKGRFEIHVNSDVNVLECASDKVRDDWLRALQETRKKSWQHIEDERNAMLLLPDRMPSTSSNMGVMIEEKPQLESPLPLQPTPLSPVHAQTLIDEYVGGTESQNSPIVEHKDQGMDRSVTSPTPRIPIPINPQHEASMAEELAESASSTFYLATDGQLNDKSMEMPKEIVSPEQIVERLAEKTNEGLEKPKKAFNTARKSIRDALHRDKECDECKKRSTSSASAQETESRCIELEDKLNTMEEAIGALKRGLLTAQKQVETLKHLESLGGDEDVKEFMLEKEAQITDLQMANNAQNRRIQKLEEETRELEAKNTDLQNNVDAFRDSIRSKEAVIMKFVESQQQQLAAREGQLLSDVEVPEGILIDMEAVGCDDAARRMFDEANVSDVNEMKDLVEAYRSQNTFLNHEVVELNNRLHVLERIREDYRRRVFDADAMYYKLKSRYLMVLNHFKSPEKPGKIMEPGVLRELLEDANRTIRQNEENAPQNDSLGFYLKNRGKAKDLLETAAEYMHKANEIVHPNKLEQSEGYMRWLESWDSFLVNWVDRELVASDGLKNLIRTGVPPAYRTRVWKSLVRLSVKDKQSELGNGYYQCMLKKATAKKEEGVYDSAIKQIDLDLARTLPTNKYFDDPGSERMDKLRNVLYAYRSHNKEVGYCQGLNRLAAIALLYLEEEDSFWFLVACVEHLQPEGYYTSTLIGAVADQKVLRDLVGEKLPNLAKHLRQLEVDLSLFSLCWFLTCFVDILPHHIYLNIFDVFLYEGNKILFRFALAVLKLCEPRVVQCKTIGTVHSCLSKASETVTDYKSLAQVAFNDLNPFPAKAIETKRQLYLSQMREQGHS